MSESNSESTHLEVSVKVQKLLAALQPPQGQEYLLSAIPKTGGQIWPIAAYTQKEEGEKAQKRLCSLITEEGWEVALTPLCYPVKVGREELKVIKPSTLLPPPKVRGTVSRVKDI